MKTDSQLQQDAMAQLAWNPAIHAAQIGVEVHDGVVTLAGQVSSYAEKWDAKTAVQQMADVKTLAVEMTVKLSQFGQRGDADIAAAAEHILSWTSSLPADAIKVMVDGGWLTWSGDVEWQYQRQDAAQSVRYLPGVRGVSNQIGIKPAVVAAVVKADIEAALRRRAAADAETIEVGVSGAHVPLTGTVHSWAERELAGHAAWGAAGVCSVIDKMTLTA